jgi:hypothetical protein
MTTLTFVHKNYAVAHDKNELARKCPNTITVRSLDGERVLVGTVQRHWVAAMPFLVRVFVSFVVCLWCAWSLAAFCVSFENCAEI